MKVRFLGTGTAVPSLSRLSSSCLVQSSTGKILVDAGPSVVRRLLEFGWTVDDVDAIILTHFHPDHAADLTTFLFSCSYGEVERKKDLLLIGGRGLELFFKRLSLAYPSIKPKGYSLTLCPLAKSDRIIPGDISIRTLPMSHRRESIGIRMTEGDRSIVFSGDTDYSENLVALTREADVLVVECSFPESKVKGHLNLATLEKIVEKARPRQVILTHLYPRWEGFRGVLHSPFLLAEDGLEIDLQP